jgi:acetyltransferase-like isoleucine patch superfamily enzyme
MRDKSVGEDSLTAGSEAAAIAHGGRKNLLRRVANRILHALARVCPGSYGLRPRLHRWRGVKIGRGVFIGEDVYLENEYPEAIEIGDNCEIGLRTVILAHLRGPGRVVIGRNSFIGPCCLIAGANDRVLTIGEGAVIGGGAVITADVPAGVMIKPPAYPVAAQVQVPLVGATYQEFVRGLRPPGARRRSTPGRPQVAMADAKGNEVGQSNQE